MKKKTSIVQDSCTVVFCQNNNLASCLHFHSDTQWLVVCMRVSLCAAGVKLHTSASAAAAVAALAQIDARLLCVNAAPVPLCVSGGGTSVGACPTVTAVILTHALQAMLFLQGLATQRAGGAAGEGTWHQMMPVAAACFLFGLLPLFFLLLFFSVLTLQKNKNSKHGGSLVFFVFS